MSLPRKLNVFGQTWKVKVTSVDIQYAGYCDRSSHTIVISDKQSKEELWHTLIHEILHASVSRVSINQTLSPELEEVIVDTFATVLMENNLIKTDS
jgi:hypothetical protein